MGQFWHPFNPWGCSREQSKINISFLPPPPPPASPSQSSVAFVQDLSAASRWETVFIFIRFHGGINYLVVQMPTTPFGKTRLLLHAQCRQLQGAADTTKYLSDRNQLGFTLCCRAFTQRGNKKTKKPLPCSLKCCFSFSQYFLPLGRGAWLCSLTRRG